jgi:hypothetical protein
MSFVRHASRVKCRIFAIRSSRWPTFASLKPADETRSRAFALGLKNDALSFRHVPATPLAMPIHERFSLSAFPTLGKLLLRLRNLNELPLSAVPGPMHPFNQSRALFSLFIRLFFFDNSTIHIPLCAEVVARWSPRNPSSSRLAFRTRDGLIHLIPDTINIRHEHPTSHEYSRFAFHLPTINQLQFIAASITCSVSLGTIRSKFGTAIFP